MKKKTGRNEPCPCGSGKKFKKCCERKMIGKKYMATKIETKSSPGSITGLFKNSVSTSDANLSRKNIKAFVKPKEKDSEFNF